MSGDKSSIKNSLVSVICRTIGRQELQQAVQSLQSQTYPNVELIIVDARGQGTDVTEEQCQPLSLSTVSTGEPLSRSQAANMGLEKASGEFLMFLDDDDWVAHDHIRTLINYLSLHKDIKAAYSSTQKTDSSGNTIDCVFEQSYDPLLLMRDNYIPIHSMVFHRSLIEKGCKFDNSFDIYEDWDFWLQISRLTAIHHVPVLSAFYRSGGDSQTTSGDEFDRFRSNTIQGDARSKIFTKWKTIWQGSELNELIGSIYINMVNEIRRLSEDIENQHQHQAELTKSIRKLEKNDSVIRAALIEEQEIRGQTNQQLEQEQGINRQLGLQIDELISNLEQQKTVTEQLSQHIGELDAHIGRVENAHKMIEDSIFWKITSPLRFIRNFLTRYKSIATPKKSTIAPSGIGETDYIEENIQPTSETYKNSHDKEAGELLRKFIESQNRLVLPAAGDPQLSIILVLYNQAHLSLCCIKSILKHASVAYELIIVDNNSTDQTPELLALIENSKIIHNKKNLGFVKAVNQGAKLSKGKNILLLNNDAVVEQNAIENALHTLQSDSEIGAVGAKIKFLDGRLQEAGSIIWSDGYCLGYGRNESADDPEFNFFRDVDYCSGAFLLFSREDFEALEGFDEQFSPAYYEESDFCIRLRQSGKKIVYCPDAQITHYEFASSGGFDSATELQIAHRKLLLKKHEEFLCRQHEKNPSNILAARSANDFPNILIIDDQVPYPLLGAGYPRCNYILTKLSKFPLNISFYPLQFPHDNWDNLYQTIPKNVEVIVDKGLSGLAEFLISRKGFYDFVMVSRIHNMEIVDKLMTSTPNFLGNARLIYDAEAVTSPREVLRRRLLGEDVNEADADILLADEIKASRNADKIVVVSANEAEIYKNYDYFNTVVLGHAMPIKASSSSFQRRNGLLFVGSLRDEGSPNVDSLLWFVDNVLPLIEKEIPEIILNVVGGNSATSLAAISKPNVLFTGGLETLQHVYNDNRIFIAPTRFAAGIPHKIHEASANGIPTVATSLLIRQLSWSHGEQILSADSAQQFAEQCIELYRNEDLWNKIRNGSMAAVEKDCSEIRFHKILSSLFDLED
jgi:GT2 family glycosyltransferase/glycosyltransferase involved in cell wall biosynthesis